MPAAVTRSNLAIDNKLTPDWPVLYHTGGDDELLVFQSASQFDAAIRQPDHDIQAYCLVDPDSNGVLIDAHGCVFKWAAGTTGATYRATEKQLPLPDVVELVRRHAALQGHCCVAKIGAGSITQAIALVEHLNQ